MADDAFVVYIDAGWRIVLTLMPIRVVVQVTGNLSNLRGYQESLRVRS